MGKDAILWKGKGFFFSADGQGKIREHAGFEAMIRVGNERTYADGSGGHIDLRFDQVNFS